MAGCRGSNICPPRPHSVVISTALLEGVVGTPEYVASWSEAREAWNPQSAAGVQSEGGLLGGVLHCPQGWCQSPMAHSPRTQGPIQGSAVTAPQVSAQHFRGLGATP